MVEPQGFLQALGLALHGIEIFAVLEEQPASSFENVLLQVVGGLTVQVFAELGELPVVELNDMETTVHPTRAYFVL